MQPVPLTAKKVEERPLLVDMMKEVKDFECKMWDQRKQSRKHSRAYDLLSHSEKYVISSRTTALKEEKVWKVAAPYS